MAKAKGMWSSIESFSSDVLDHPLESAGVAVAAPLILSAAGAAAVAAPTIASGAAAYEDYQAAQLAKEQGKANAAAEAARTAETIRVTEEENKRAEATARARAAASGLSGASSEIYISALEESGRQDIDWLKQVGASSYDAAIAGGESAYHQATAAMWGNIGGMASGGMGSIAGFM